MRDFLTEIIENQPLDPREAARRGTRPQLRKRFYYRAEAGKNAGEAGGFPLLLDGKPVKTPGRRQLAAPTRALAGKIAEEWDVQQDVIDPARMPLTRLANAVIDAVADANGAVADDVAQYLSTDLLCYRAEAPEGLVERQGRAWDPVLAWANQALGAHFVLAQGVLHVTQPGEAVAAARAGIPAEPWRLGAVSSITTLTGSALLALALERGVIDADVAWAAAHVDEDWQISQWGSDQEALGRRAYRRSEFDAAVTVLRHTALVTLGPMPADGSRNCDRSGA
jgi:chaperone required for assembly of F1-ATPase